MVEVEVDGVVIFLGSSLYLKASSKRIIPSTFPLSVINPFKLVVDFLSNNLSS